jgi:hypothetical protein
MPKGTTLAERSARVVTWKFSPSMVGVNLDATFRHGPDSLGCHSHTIKSRLRQVSMQLVKQALIFNRHFSER